MRTTEYIFAWACNPAFAHNTPHSVIVQLASEALALSDQHDQRRNPSNRPEIGEAKRRTGKDRTAHEAQRGKKKPKTGLSNLSKIRLTLEEHFAAVEMMDKESDRGLAIMGAAMIEDALLQAISAKFKRQDVDELLFHEIGAPLSTFRDKIIIAYALGILADDSRADVDLIRSIRNQYSHALRPLTFDQPEIMSSCEGFKRHCDPCTVKDWDAAAARHAFRMACSSLTGQILTQTVAALQARRARSSVSGPGLLAAS